jgi:CopG family transcriptional regulator, nickel-responsive regulator
LKAKHAPGHKHIKNPVSRISMSLPSNLLKELENSMVQAGFSDRSKAIQAALYSFVDENKWNGAENQLGAGVIVLLYDSHVYNQDRKYMHLQHEFTDIISASTHVHLDHQNCLETILLKGQNKRIKELVRAMSQNRGIKTLKLNFMTPV